MNLNNKWHRNIDNGHWSNSIDSLKVSDFKSLVQDLKSYRFYQKCLSGSTYVGVNSNIIGVTSSSYINDVYDILSVNSNSFYYNNVGSNPLPYSESFVGTNPEYPSVISSTPSLYNFVEKSLPEYNFTLKNLFTPERLIKDQKDNMFYVDVTSTDLYDSLSIDFTGLIIDGITVKEGHRILIKDQYRIVTIPTLTDPNNFFYGHYEFYSTTGTNTSYKIPTSDNGIYVFNKKRLVRTTDLDEYSNLINYSICTKLGNTNKEKQFKLCRLKNGYFPEYNKNTLYPGGPIGESVFFEECHNFVLRQRVDYNNLYELSLQETIKHSTYSIVADISLNGQRATYSYTIPERTIVVGEFGSIINTQENITNIIDSKYKSTLRSITQTNRYYWICGDDGVLLKVDKIDFSIDKIDLNYSNNNQKFDNLPFSFTSISFFNDLIGAVVGKFNQIWITMDGGNTWKQLFLEDFDGYDYNKILFTNINKFYVSGNNGIFIEFEYNLGNWTAYKRRISKYMDGLSDEYLLVDDILDMSYFTQSSNSFIAMSCRANSIFIYDISNSISSTYSFISVNDTNNNNFGDINSITYNDDSNNLLFSTFNGIYQFDPFDGYISNNNSNIFSTTFSVFMTQSSINSINYIDSEVLFCGNFSLWMSNDFSSTYSIYDNTFFDRLKPRLLFMDYDIGSKLYWFDDYGQYRLPSRYNFPTSLLQDGGSFSHISFDKCYRYLHDSTSGTTYSYIESNWISYFKDRQKTFEYYSNLDQSFVVEPSFIFSSSNIAGITYSYSGLQVSNQYSDIVSLMPSAVPPMKLSSLTQSSRFREISGTPISSPSSTHSLYFYDYLGVWSEDFVESDVLPEVGDVLSITSDIFDGNFIINKIFSTSSSYTQAISSESQLRFFQLTELTQYQYVATMSVSYGTVSLFGTFSFNSSTYLPPASNQLSNLLYDITSLINLNTTTTGFSAFYSFNNPNGIINIIAPPGSSYNGTSPTLSFSYYGKPLLQILSPTEFTGGFDSLLQTRYYYYFYTDFNQNILNNIPNSITGFTIRNLNKFPRSQDVDSINYFKDNFNSHYISRGYGCDIIYDNETGTQSYQITPKYSQWSAYYNLESNINLLDVYSVTHSTDIKYPSGFLNFGYSPTYNILNYLNFLDNSEFVPDKEFYSMPNWYSIPGPDNLIFTTQSGLYLDAGVESNKIYFGIDIKYIWDSLFIWTFIDIELNYSTSSFISEKLLIINKYFSNGYYVIEFHDSIKSDYPGSVSGSGNNPFYYNIDSFNIFSRRKLKQISDDLEYINKIQRPKSLIVDSYDLNTTIGSTQGSWGNYETDIDFKISTDSYSKILLSDYSIIKSITGILYTDFKYELALQITKLDREYEFEVANISLFGSNYQFDFSSKHLLSDNDSVVVSMIGTQSDYPSELLGYHNIITNGEYSIILPVQSVGLFGFPNFKISYIKKDPFLNYQPIDIFDVGIGDKKIKQSVEITTDNWDLVGDSYNLIDLDLSKYKFRLIDGLDLISLNSKFSWILEAEISNAIIGLDENNNLVWYSGIWYCGRWFGGTWISGYWMGGDWYYGKWTSKSISDNLLKVKVDNRTSNNYNSSWFGGRWFGGTWENGTWYDGRWYDGTWNNGTWYDGTWNNGTWDNGLFTSGIWVDGIWNNGIFNTNNGQSYWLDGKFFGGDFENGIWYNGIFDEKNGKYSRFGVKSFNSRNSIWKSGKFLSGEFHSFLNINDNGLPDVSDVHKYTKWYTGVFGGGTFYGGLCYNINFKNTTWRGGISEDIKVININAENNTIGLLGEYDFNINDEIYIVDNQNYNTFSYYGSTDYPQRYKVLTSIYDTNNNITNINVDTNLQNSLGDYLIDGLWEIKFVESDYSGSLLQFFTYLDFGTSGDSFSELVNSTMFINNQNIIYTQNGTPSAAITYDSFETYYDNMVIDLTVLNPILPSTCTYSIEFGQHYLSATLSITQDVFSNPSGYTVNIEIIKIPISGSVSNLRCVSNFENSAWDSGLWYNGVFKDGTFNGGLWYNGYFEGNWG